MATQRKRAAIAVTGSERAPVPGARIIGPVGDDETIDITLRLRHAKPANAARVYRTGVRRATDTAPLTREQLAAIVGADEADVNAVEAFVLAHGLTVGRVSLAERTMHVRGPASAMRAAFGVNLERAKVAGRTFRQRTGDVNIAGDLKDIVTGVFGLDDRSQAGPHFKRLRGLAQPNAAMAQPHAAAQPNAATPHVTFNGYVPADLSRAYEFPVATGAGQCIALIELDGGFKPTDIAKYFAAIRTKAPRVIAIGVDGASNAPTGNPDGPDGEVVLDIEVAGGVAPGATIAVYFAPNTDRGFLDAISLAVHDTRLRPTVISISWGAPESQWTQQSMHAMEQLFQEAAALGVPVFVASGDNGAKDGTTSLQVDFPAASPSAIACGGTRLDISNGKRVGETVWNDGKSGGATGGGFSKHFNAPAFQSPYIGTTTGRRGVPDVSANADPETGYRVMLDDQWFIIGGTSAVAPLMAGLIARCNEKGKRSLRDLQARLYGTPATRATRKVARMGSGRRKEDKMLAAATQAASATTGTSVPVYFTDITQGNNRSGSRGAGFIAKTGWDACTGLGVPIGTALLENLWGTKAAPKIRRR